jgi:V8-like Glu-specific endopeptidase
MVKIKLLSLFILTITTLCSFAQKNTLLIFDLKNHRIDSIVNLPYDSTKPVDKTNFYAGTFNDQIATLEQQVPVNNIYPGSQFTRKKRASSDYDVTKYPIRTTIKMFYVQNDTVNDLCSGSFVSRSYVLTAAHCVAGLNSNTLLFDSIYVCPGFDNGIANNPFPCSWVQKIFIFKNWSMNGDDFALLQLEEPVGELTGWISIGYNTLDSSLQNGIFYKFSYPAITNFAIDSTEYNGDTLYYNYGKIDIISKNFIGINHARANQGESGSSIIKVENNLEYTSYGVLSFSSNLMHSKLNNWSYSYLESVIHNDLSQGVQEEMNENSFTISPNPSSDKIRVKHNPKIDIRELFITDVYGRQVLSVPIDGLRSDIEISRFPEGIYFMIIKTSKSHIIKKLIIHRI